MNKNYEFFFTGQSPFSNWNEGEFNLYDETFHCGEQAMMWIKAQIFGDLDKAESIVSVYNPDRIMMKDINNNLNNNFNDLAKDHLSYNEINDFIKKTNKPKIIKKMGREVGGFDQDIWDEIKTRVMYMVIKGKFSTNGYYKTALENTGSKIMVEASPYDKVWGIGLSAEKAKNIPENQWPGQNLLGKMMTKYKQDVENNNVKNFSLDNLLQIGIKKKISLSSNKNNSMSP